MTTALAAVDPGDSCGFCFLVDGDRVAYGQGEPLNVIGQVTGFLRFHLGKPDTYAAVACERFTISRRTARLSPQRGALDVTAELRADVHRLGVAVSLQSPSDAKRLAPDKLLRSLGLWLTGGDLNLPDANDANDATRHALLWLARHRAATLDALLAAAKRPG